jgi:caffeoyl-CoA O-methyltransferase
LYDTAAAHTGNRHIYRLQCALPGKGIAARRQAAYHRTAGTKAAAAFKEAGLDETIHLHIGNALEIIPQLDEDWDIVFIDADKTGYIDYYELILPKLKQGGFIIADNVLFHGEVLQDEIKGKSAKAIDAFNRHVAADAQVEQVLLTVRDGLMIIKKL